VVVTRRKPRKPKQTQAAPLCRRKRQGKKNNPRHIRSKKRSKTNKRQETQPINLLEQQSLVPVTLEEFFPTRFFEKVTVNMTSYYEMEDEEEGDEDKLEKSSENKVRALTIREACQHAWFGDKSSTYQKKYISKLLLHCTESSMLKVKDAGPLMKDAA